LEAKAHGELEGRYEVISSAGGLDTIGGAADEGLAGAKAFGVGDNATVEVSIDYAWEGASCTIAKSCHGENTIHRMHVKPTWEGALASEEGRGGRRNSGAEKGEGNCVETHYVCVEWG
jgi:hypothetical protein